MSGHGFSGLMWSRVSGEMPPQSLRPAARRRPPSRGERFGGAWMFTSGPSRSRATASVRSVSWSEGSGCSRIGIRGFARKGWTMTSWMWPCVSCRSRIAASASTRSRGVSPIPMRTPVVNGIASLPASAIVLRRRAGTLSGARSWAIPRASRRSATVSSMSPMLTLTSRRADRSRSLITPGFACGSSGVSASTRAHGAEIPERRAVAVAPEELAVLREDGLRLIAEGEERLLRAEPAAGLRERDDLVGCQGPRAGLAWIPAERAVAAVVAAQRGERHEDLRRERHRASSAPVAHLRGAREELVERRGRRLDEPARLGVGDHARVLRLRPLARTIVDLVTARLVGGTASARTTFGLVTARLVGGTASARTTFGRTSSAKRSMLASTWPDSWWVGSKTKWETPSAAYVRMSAATSSAVPWKSGR